MTNKTELFDKIEKLQCRIAELIEEKAYSTGHYKRPTKKELLMRDFSLIWSSQGQNNKEVWAISDDIALAVSDLHCNVLIGDDEIYEYKAYGFVSNQ